MVTRSLNDKTKEELYDIAVAMEISGRSTMDKAELVEAISRTLLQTRLDREVERKTALDSAIADLEKDNGEAYLTHRKGELDAAVKRRAGRPDRTPDGYRSMTDHLQYLRNLCDENPKSVFLNRLNRLKGFAQKTGERVAELESEIESLDAEVKR